MTKLMMMVLALQGCDHERRCEGRECSELAAVAPSGVEALALYDEGCSQQAWEACGEAARMREFGDGVTVDQAGAWSGYQRLCDGGVQRGCMAMANMLRKGTAPGGSDPDRARSLLEASCDAQEALSCVSLAQLELQEGRLPQARSAAARGCELGEPFGCGLAAELEQVPAPPPEADCSAANPTACVELASWRILHGTPDDQQAAVVTLEQLCSQGTQDACIELGFCASQGMGMTADPSRAAALYRAACPSHPRGCYNLGLLYSEGRGVPHDPSASLDLLERACDGGMAEGCLMAGNALLDAGETARADAGFERACSQGLPLGCVNLAVGLLASDSRSPDPTRGLRLLEEACEAGEPYGCANLGHQLATGVHIPADPPRAAALLNQSCEQGVDAACLELGLR